VRQVGHRLGFLQEPAPLLAGTAAVPAPGANQLDCDRTSQLRILRRPDRAHSAHADEPGQRESTDAIARLAGLFG